jgi:3-oxoacyl-[acyl-carrier-protein] synthase-3
MKVDWPAVVAGTGVGLPAGVLTNADWVKRLDTSDEWIVTRTGIRERRICGDGESTLPLAVSATRAAMADASVTPQDIDLLICATVTPEHTLPSTSCELQAALGLRSVPALDQVAACSGFVCAMITAAQYIHSGFVRTALVVGVDCMTRLADMEDRQSAILFGDGAGAAVLRRSDTHAGVRAARMGSDGTRAQLIWVPAGGTREPLSPRTVNERLHVMRMRGRDVYRFAVTNMQDVIQQTVADAGLTLDDIHLIIPHQSNLRIIESVCERMGFPLERVFVNIDRYGNTSSASVPIAMHEARMAGRISPGDRVLLAAFGAGLVWASILLEF